VTGGRLSITPDYANQPWVILVSAGINSDSGAEIAVEVQLLVDGVPRGLGGVQTNTPTDRNSYAAFDVLRGDTSTHVVQLQLRDAAGSTSRVTDFHLLAFSLPMGAELMYAEDLGQRVVPVGFLPYVTIDVTPKSPGDYLILGGVSATEAPSGSNVGVHIVDPQQNIWPENELYFNHRTPWYAFLWARVVHLDVPGTFRLEAEGDVSPSTIQMARLAAIRTNAFDAVETTEDLPTASSTSTTGEVRSSVVTATPPGARDYVVLQHLAFEVHTTTFNQGALFKRDGTTIGSNEFFTASAGNHAGLASTTRTAQSMTLTTEMYVTDASTDARGFESVIHALRLRP
jgi:hypothetical protein